MFLSGVSGDELASELTQAAGRIRFIGVGGTEVPISLLTGSWGQIFTPRGDLSPFSHFPCGSSSNGILSLSHALNLYFPFRHDLLTPAGEFSLLLSQPLCMIKT